MPTPPKTPQDPSVPDEYNGDNSREQSVFDSCPDCGTTAKVCPGTVRSAQACDWVETTARCLHVIPVPEGMTPEEAWAEIVTMGRLVEPDGGCSWAQIECDGQECTDIEKEIPNGSPAS